MRKGTKTGPKFSSPHTKKRAIIREARTLRDRWSAAAKAQKRHLASLAKGLFLNVADHGGTDVRGCDCPPRVVDSLTLEDYLHLQENLQALSVQDRSYEALRYATDQQLLLNTCCSPTPQHISKGVDSNPL